MLCELMVLISTYCDDILCTIHSWEGPSVEGQLCLQQSVDVPPADIPAPPVDGSKVMEIPGELKQRWKPFGSSE